MSKRKSKEDWLKYMQERCPENGSLDIEFYRHKRKVLFNFYYNNCAGMRLCGNWILYKFFGVSQDSATESLFIAYIYERNSDEEILEKICKLLGLLFHNNKNTYWGD
jgi:hypothetical protein